MPAEAWPLGKPRTHFGVSIRGVAAQHRGHVQARGHRRGEVSQNAEKFLMAVTALAVRDDVACGDIQRGEQGRCAMWTSL